MFPARIRSVKAALLFALTCTATAQIAVLQIQVVEGDGATHAPGTRVVHPLTVEVKDQTGKPVAGAAVTFHLPEEGLGGAFPNGIRTAVVPTDALGRASLRGLRVNQVPGSFQIRIYASKEQARSGVVSVQHIAAPSGGLIKARPGRWRKWIVTAAIVGGAAAAGAVVASRSGSPTAPTAPSIGSPSIVVVKP